MTLIAGSPDECNCDFARQTWPTARRSCPCCRVQGLWLSLDLFLAAKRYRQRVSIAHEKKVEGTQRIQPVFYLLGLLWVSSAFTVVASATSGRRFFLIEFYPG